MLLELLNISKKFILQGSFFKKKTSELVLDDVNLKIEEGKTLALIGESGSGKSTLAKIILKLLSPTSGKIYFEGKDIFQYSNKESFVFRKKLQIIFQNPLESLNQYKNIRSILSEPMIIHSLYSSKKEVDKKIDELLGAVSLPKNILNKYPHEFSGGERQRIAIARVLALRPKLIVCDECVSALDVSIQAQILDLLMKLQKEFKMAYLFISHDLNVVRLISNNIAVIYRGRIIENAPTKEIFDKPKAEYTKKLLDSILKL